MPAIRSLFRNSALLSKLVTAEQLEQAVLTAGVAVEVGAPAAEVDDGALANRLVEMGVLTAYQANQIKAGRTKFDLGPYVVTDLLGQGGMGQVFKGVHRMMGRECAIKVLPLHKATPDAIVNFMREIRTQAQLDHPNLVRAYDAGREDSTTGKHTHYLVVEYVPGVDLRKLVRKQGPLTQQQAASVVMQAARGLDYAHKRGLVHRDVKPGNILVTSQGVAKVSDLGLAGFLYDVENDPRAGKIVGTADYLAPEQIRSPGEVSHLIDIYSLGCTLYYAVCGKVPFPGGTARDKARRHCSDTPWHPRRFNPDLDEEFVEVIADMMEKDPKARVQSAAEVVERLELWAGDAAPITPRASIRSPWSAAPPPGGTDEEKESLQDTDGGEASASGAEGSASQMSQGTMPVASGETAPMRSRSKSAPTIPPPMPPRGPFGLDPWTLTVSIPLSMFVGALIAALAFWIWR